MFDQIHRKVRFERAKKTEISDDVIAAWVSRDGLGEAIGFLLLFSSTSVLLEGWGDLRRIRRGSWSIFLESIFSRDMLDHLVVSFLLFFYAEQTYRGKVPSRWRAVIDLTIEASIFMALGLHAIQFIITNQQIELKSCLGNHSEEPGSLDQIEAKERQYLLPIGVLLNFLKVGPIFN
jgi:hypothetical protein